MMNLSEMKTKSTMFSLLVGVMLLSTAVCVSCVVSLIGGGVL